MQPVYVIQQGVGVTLVVVCVMVRVGGFMLDGKLACLRQPYLERSSVSVPAHSSVPTGTWEVWKYAYDRYVPDMLVC